MKHPQLTKNDMPVFDLSRTGKRLMAERQDEPGAEELSLDGHGSRGFTEDLSGQWGWKPQRDKALGECFNAFRFTDIGAERAYNEPRTARVWPRVVPSLVSGGGSVDPETNRKVRNLKVSLL